MNERGDLHVYADAPAVSRALAECFVKAGNAAIAENGSFHVALSGGNTPRAAYELLAGEPFRSSLSWNNVFVYFGDERCVPPTDERSNFGMARAAFLDAIPVPTANVRRMSGEVDPGHAANEYSTILRTDLGQLPRFDLVLLGLGEDAHTASLFPGRELDRDQDSLVEAVYHESDATWRLTITPKVINAAYRVVFAVEGASKAPALAAVYEGSYDPRTYPAQIVRPTSGQLTWLVDEAAASLLSERTR